MLRCNATLANFVDKQWNWINGKKVSWSTNYDFELRSRFRDSPWVVVNEENKDEEELDDDKEALVGVDEILIGNDEDDDEE